MSSNFPSPPPAAGSKVLTAFVAGAIIGALSVAQLAPAGVSSAAPGLGAPTDVTSTDGVFDDATAGLDGSDFGDGIAIGDTGSLGGGSTTGAGTSTGTVGGSSGGAAGGGTTGSGSTSTSGTSSGGGSATAGSGPGGGADATSGDASAGEGSTGGGGVDIGGTDSGTGGSSTTGGGGGPGAGCTTANNGGKTDTGVTADTIRVAATVVEDGAGASLLKQASIGMKAVLNKVNSKGGICGRRIQLETKNDSWDAQRGNDFIRRFIEEENFALLVVPSSEGLAVAIQSGVISSAQIPVVGTTGLRIDEYREPWVFPVATATISYMRGMAKYSYEQLKHRNFGIVWDNKFKFGVEGATAFKDYLKTLPGAVIKADMPINPDQAKYGTEAQKFNQECGNAANSSACDMVALLLVPDTALKWKNDNAGGLQGRGKRTFGAQTLFTDDFGTKCGSWCDGLVVWTGYNPPIPPADNADVQRYVKDVQGILPSVDTKNQFVEGAYLGAELFVKAVEACSPKLTRVCIRQTLDSTDYNSGFANKLVWRSGNHHANKFAQAFAADASGGSFNGWTYLNTGWIRDPSL